MTDEDKTTGGEGQLNAQGGGGDAVGQVEGATAGGGEGEATPGAAREEMAGQGEPIPEEAALTEGQAEEAVAGADAEAIQPSEPSSGASLETWMKDMRHDALALEKEARSIPKHVQFECKESCEGQHGEMLAQAKLAVRAFEDARMRLGKVLQYHQTGHSIYGD